VLIEKALKGKGLLKGKENTMSVEALIIGKRNAQNKKIIGRMRLVRVLVAKVARNLIQKCQ